MTRNPRYIGCSKRAGKTDRNALEMGRPLNGGRRPPALFLTLRRQAQRADISLKGVRGGGEVRPEGGCGRVVARLHQRRRRVFAAPQTRRLECPTDPEIPEKEQGEGGVCPLHRRAASGRARRIAHPSYRQEGRARRKGEPEKDRKNGAEIRQEQSPPRGRAQLRGSEVG